MISKGKIKTPAEKEWLETVVNFAHESNWLNKIYGSLIKVKSLITSWMESVTTREYVYLEVLCSRGAIRILLKGVFLIDHLTETLATFYARPSNCKIIYSSDQ